MSGTETPPDSLLPYEAWAEQALREVVVRALEHVRDHGLPGDHHFYLTFRTDHPGAVLPPRLRAQYPREMTIVLQHQFWDLSVDRAARLFGVALSFGNIPANLVIPFDAFTAFADPHVRFGLQFQPAGTPGSEPAEDEEEFAEPDEAEEAEVEAAEAPAVGAEPQVVSLDAFRRRGTQKD